MANTLKVTLVKSPIGAVTETQKNCCSYGSYKNAQNS